MCKSKKVLLNFVFYFYCIFIAFISLFGLPLLISLIFIIYGLGASSVYGKPVDIITFWLEAFCLLLIFSFSIVSSVFAAKSIKKIIEKRKITNVDKLSLIISPIIIIVIIEITIKTFPYWKLINLIFPF